MTAFDREVETLRLPDGRRLGWCEYGDPAGRPVLAFHGTPACRLLFAPADTPAARLGLRVIAPDRPGYGQSDPEPGRTLSQWSSDVDALLDHLGVREAPILAISGGGPYAVATAAHLGQRITGLALVSPLGDVGDPKARRVLARLDRTLFVTLPRWPRVVRRVALTGRAAFLAAPEAALMSLAATLSPADRRTLSTPLARRVMIAATREALRQGVGGALSDLDIFSRPWGVDPGAITTPAVLWQGTSDRVVPAALTFELAAHLGDCRLRRLEGQGHFWVLEHIDEVMRVVAGLPFRA